MNIMNKELILKSHQLMNKDSLVKNKLEKNTLYLKNVLDKEEMDVSFQVTPEDVLSKKKQLKTIEQSCINYNTSESV